MDNLEKASVFFVPLVIIESGASDGRIELPGTTRLGNQRLSDGARNGREPKKASQSFVQLSWRLEEPDKDDQGREG